jgi:Questin oxidase-like
MSSIFSLGNFGLPRFASFGITSSAARPIKLPPTELINIEASADRTKRRLKHLIKANHANHSIIYHHLQFHNHTAHILGSAYFFGSTPEHLVEIYDKEAKQLEEWHDSPGEITKDDWRQYLGKREYQRAFVDFFEDQLVGKGYDWRKLMDEFLFSGKEPLINNMISGRTYLGEESCALMLRKGD